jgi:hypothetical protein
MKLVTYRASVEAAASLGVLMDDLVVDVPALGESFGEELPDSMLGLIDLGRGGLSALRACLDEAGHFRARRGDGACECDAAGARFRGRARTSSGSG